MANVKLQFASGLYDRMLPLYTKDVRPEGIDLEFIVEEDPRAIFDRMVREQAYDLSEMSSSEFIQRTSRGQCPFVALPVFPSRVFRQGYIVINRKSGIRTAKDFEGRRIGVQLHTMTAAVFIRGLLQHEYGVDLSTIHWVQGAMDTPGTHGSPTVLPMLKPVALTINTSHYSLSDLLERGDVYAIIGPHITRRRRSFRSCTWWRSGRRSTSGIRSSARACIALSATPRRWRSNTCGSPARRATCCRG